MAGPYDIQQVDIPGLLGMHQGLKRQRIADLMSAREYEMKVKQDERQDRKEQALSSIFMKGGDQSSAGVGAPSQGPAPVAPMQPAQPDAVMAPALPAIDQPLPPRTDGISIDQNALQRYYAIDPKAAAEIQTLVYNSSKQQLEQATARGEAMAVAADALRAVPPGERQAQFQSRWAPWLAERGLPPQALQQADLSDQGLDGYYKQGMTLSQVVAKNKPDLRVVPLGGTVYDVNARAAVTQPTGGPQAGQVVDGYRFKGGDLNDPSAWEEAGGGDATSTFP